MKRITTVEAARSLDIVRLWVRSMSKQWPGYSHPHHPCAVRAIFQQCVGK